MRFDISGIEIPYNGYIWTSSIRQIPKPIFANLEVEKKILAVALPPLCTTEHFRGLIEIIGYWKVFRYLPFAVLFVKIDI